MSITRNLLLACAMGLIATGSVVQAAPMDTIVKQYSFHLSLDAGGKITALDYTGAGGNDSAEAKALEPTIRTWVFQPGKVDGVPMPTDTTLTVNMGALKSSGSQEALGIMGACTGAYAEKVVVPSYPSQALLDQAEARVIVVIAVDANGNVDKVDFSGTSPMSAFHRKLFEAAVTDASKGWRFRPETVGGRPMAARMTYPVDFCIGATPCARVKEEAVAQDGTVPKSQPTPLDSQVTLVTQVGGNKL